MNIPFLGIAIDERFLTHRLRSTSLGGISAALLAAGLFWYHHFKDHEWRWELMAIVATMAIVKIAAMIWYFSTD